MHWYCSKFCKAKGHQQRTRGAKRAAFRATLPACPICQRQFDHRRKDQVYCSGACSSRADRLKHPDRDHQLYLKNRVERLVQAREYQLAHPEVHKAANERYEKTENGQQSRHKSRKAYRARKFAAPGSHTRAQFLDLVRRFDNFCPACGEQFLTGQLEEDHIVPLSRGGSDDISNIQPLCKSCNSRKRDRMMDYRPKVQERFDNLYFH